MDGLTLVIGNKNYSSWSLRPWLVLRHLQVPFTEVRIPLYQADSQEKLAQWSPSGLVPVLHDADVTVWDSLAICEYLHDRYPAQRLWPSARGTRAVARAVCAEMHAGFTALRRSMPMNCRGRFPGKGRNPESERDIARILAIWRECRTAYGADGDFLFGAFSIADAMFAPVALRFHTYGVTLDTVGEAYVNAILALPDIQAWIADARREPERLEQFELYG